MADETVTLEAPDAGGAEIESSDALSSGISEGQESTESTGASVIDDGRDEPKEDEVDHLRGSELWRAVKEKFRKADLSGQELRSIRRAIHIAGRANDIAGGDFSQLEAREQAYSQLAMPGEEGLAPEQIVEARVEDSRQLAGIIEDLEAGGEKMFQELIADRPEMLQGLLPKAMDWLSEANNEVFSSYVARSTMSYLNSMELPVQFALLDRFLPQQSNDPPTQAVIEAVAAIKAAFTGLKTMAQKPLEVKAGTRKAENGANGQDRESQLAQREFENTKIEWNRTAGSGNDQTYSSELSRLAGSRKITLTDTEKQQIRAAVGEEFNTRLAANPKYGETMQGYIRAGNRRAYEDRATSEGKRLLPGIISRHFEAAVSARNAAKTQQKPNQNGNGQRTAPQAKANGSGEQIQWLTGHPKSLGKQVDLSRTTFSMLQKHQAYLVGQKGLFRWPEKKA